jgi:hypothetical protein
MSSRMDSKRDRETPSPADELTATLWCAVALLAVVLVTYWWAGAAYG